MACCQCAFTGSSWRRPRGLPLPAVDSVLPLVASLSGQNLVSVHDLYYMREATCDYNFGFVFFHVLNVKSFKFKFLLVIA